MSNHSSIPSLDLNHFRLGTPKQKQQFIQDLGNAYEEIGFAAVKNHMLPNVLEQELYNQTKAFFKLPLDVKLKYSGDALAGQRGYTGMGKEHAKGKSVGDLKEFWHFGQYLQPEDVNRFDYPNNIDVLELPAFNAVGKEAYARLEETGKYLLQAMAIFLDLEENFFNEKVHNGNSILRPIHYAPILEEPPTGAVRAGEHEDINLITLLMGASADGL
ncbi:MAG: isopenicillin N synthase-like dioxygenase, partial [Bacteroidia bacterium]